MGPKRLVASVTVGALGLDGSESHCLGCDGACRPPELGPGALNAANSFRISVCRSRIAKFPPDWLEFAELADLGEGVGFCAVDSVLGISVLRTAA